MRHNDPSHGHVADDQPLFALFTVNLDVVKARYVTGGKFKGAPRKPKVVKR